MDSLIERLIRIHTNEGDTVLDPFLGSGTTAIACRNLNRKCLGWEIDKETFITINDRLKG